MCTHPAAFHRGISQLRCNPPGSADRLLGVELALLDAIGDSVAIERLLFDMYVEDPVGTHEFEVAAHLLSLLFGSAVSA